MSDETFVKTLGCGCVLFLVVACVLVAQLPWSW